MIRVETFLEGLGRMFEVGTVGEGLSIFGAVVVVVELRQLLVGKRGDVQRLSAATVGVGGAFVEVLLMLGVEEAGGIRLLSVSQCLLGSYHGPLHLIEHNSLEGPGRGFI